MSNQISLCVGAPKCGTTWLDELLRDQFPGRLPQYCKETFFFDKQYSRGIDWYRSLFAPECEAPIEIGPSYFAESDAPRRISEHYERRRILIMLRDPYDRAASNLLHEMRRGRTWLSPEKCTVSRRSMELVSAYSSYESNVRMWQETNPEVLAVVRFPVSDPEWFCGVLKTFLLEEADDTSDLLKKVQQHLRTRVYEAGFPRSQTSARLREVVRKLVPTRMHRSAQGLAAKSNPGSPSSDDRSRELRKLANVKAQELFDFEVDREWLEEQVGKTGFVWKNGTPVQVSEGVQSQG